ncbi:MAG TPA: SLC13 family permease [Gaiellaceae bacterium]|jgi:arsenical pump membrane protein|nr:SLC13 family permease [Gaiellaceae bacterium]
MLTHAILSSLRQAWPPFALVAGLLLIGGVAAADGLFEALGARVARTGLGPRGLLLLLLALVAVVTAVLNLDTSVLFLTPVLVHSARSRGLDERPFLYGSVFMANSASLLLPSSNLTNMLVLRSDPESGLAFATRMLPAWLTACAITALFLALAYPLEEGRPRRGELPPLRLGLAAAATTGAAILVVALPDPAIPVLAIGLAVTLARRHRPQLDPRALGLLFALTITLGTLVRVWKGPAALLDGSRAWTAALVGATAALLLNNLPATVVFSTHPTPHPDALLLGLDLGPNLAVTGSLSAVLWLQTARTVDAHPSIATYSRLGVLLVPATILAGLAVFLATT